MLGNCNRNRWCCFCIHWYDPTNSALTPKPGRGMFMVDSSKLCKCQINNFNVRATSTCSKFMSKF